MFLRYWLWKDGAEPRRSLFALLRLPAADLLHALEISLLLGRPHLHAAPVPANVCVGILGHVHRPHLSRTYL